MTADDPFDLDSPGYREHVRESLRHCRCCDCADRPCAGVMAGGMCDEACRCDKSDDTRPEDYCGTAEDYE